MKGNEMNVLHYDITKAAGDFKVLNATNGGPWHTRHTATHFRSNLEDYKAANLRYSRNHDSNFLDVYGGPYAHDITAIFPNFDADPDDPESYDFACTDESILTTLDADVETFFRLGQSIEHQIKKHGTLPPKDFKKWTVICEHIIRHYNEGWADGYELGIKYWEIWNEPNLDKDDAPNKRCWGGTAAQFYDFYEIAAKHLKARFPELKIGGPSFAHRDIAWADAFLHEMSQRRVPIDFFSWHAYTPKVEVITERAAEIDELLIKYGYGNAESILNEWNYTNKALPYVCTLEAIHGAKGAAFVMASISAAEPTSIDMMMYYDTRISVYCGAFDYYTYKPLPTYYALKWYGELYGFEVVRTDDTIENVYALTGVKDGKTVTILTYYSDEDGLQDVTVKLDYGKRGSYEIYLVDSDKGGELVQKTQDPTVTLKQNTFVKIAEV